MNGRFPILWKSPLRPHALRAGRDWIIFRIHQWKIIGQVLDFEVLVLHPHGRSHMDLNRQHAFQRPTVLIEVNCLGRRMSVDPMPVMVALNQYTVVVPLVGFELLDRHLTDDP